jgi:hypothetical protein
MAVLLGEIGQIELRRTSLDEPITGTIKPSDVNASRRRFSFDFTLGLLITGDQIEIKTTDGTLLSFIGSDGWPSNQVFKDGIFYLFVNEIGGIRLYKTFDEAISGEITGSVSLVVPNRDIPISIQIRNNNERILGQVISYEVNTQRESIDSTALSDEFRREYSGLISGSGRITCFFDYERRANDPQIRGESSNVVEMPIYLNQLLLRTKVGSEFWAKVTLVGRGAKPGGRAEDVNDEVWYEFYARITNAGLSFSAGEPIESTIEFVTTGQIELRTKTVSNYLLQEDTDRIVQEANQSGFLEVEQQD